MIRRHLDLQTHKTLHTYTLIDSIRKTLRSAHEKEITNTDDALVAYNEDIGVYGKHKGLILHPNHKPNLEMAISKWVCFQRPTNNTAYFSGFSAWYNIGDWS